MLAKDDVSFVVCYVLVGLLLAAKGHHGGGWSLRFISQKLFPDVFLSPKIWGLTTPQFLKRLEIYCNTIRGVKVTNQARVNAKQRLE